MDKYMLHLLLMYEVYIWCLRLVRKTRANRMVSVDVQLLLALLGFCVQILQKPRSEPTKTDSFCSGQRCTSFSARRGCAPIGRRHSPVGGARHGAAAQPGKGRAMQMQQRTEMPILA